MATPIFSAVEAQIGKLHLQVLLDSGSVRSLISFGDFQKLNLGGQPPKLTAVDVKCSSASGDNLVIIVEALITLKIHGFSWKWKFLVSKKLRGRPILGMDFMLQN